jgi:hypothetical protein
MADLYASISSASLISSGSSKYAAEFNERLKSDVPLIDAVRWWYSAIGGADVINIDKGLEMEMELSPAEAAAFSLCLYENWEASYGAPPVTDKYAFGACDQQDCWTKLKQARAALQAQ